MLSDKTTGARGVVVVRAILPLQPFDGAVVIPVPPHGQQTPKPTKPEVTTTCRPSPLPFMLRDGGTEQGSGWMRKLGDVLDISTQAFRRAHASTTSLVLCSRDVTWVTTRWEGRLRVCCQSCGIEKEVLWDRKRSIVGSKKRYCGIEKEVLLAMSAYFSKRKAFRKWRRVAMCVHSRGVECDLAHALVGSQRVVGRWLPFPWCSAQS